MPEDFQRPPGQALGAPVLRARVAYEQPGYYPVVPDNRADTAIMSAVGDDAMPTREFRRVTANGIPVPMPPVINGSGRTDMTREMPRQGSDQVNSPTEVIGTRRPDTSYVGRHTRGVRARVRQ